ncbi:uncharacterized protein BDZ99DRAFT_573941 [Mytilinidion resinicola]|uniref:Uncharacterized protein n=1 Tax=Mytilinidion resinicola TaxID=574789 RepID=A0A6A6YCY6_9PEZI|nr:uncharacterized protein BDZ99DRAFT_573941 [Mytilinidion resinicola]KAF2806428.1 hypothetical protein BDZ99DRAFT_573941 [Mytilinidion resinicola]
MNTLSILLVILQFLASINCTLTAPWNDLDKRAANGGGGSGGGHAVGYSAGHAGRGVAITGAAALLLFHGTSGGRVKSTLDDCNGDPFAAYVYFKDPAVPDTILCINTPWYYRYNHDLRGKALPNAGFVDVSMEVYIPYCGWQHVGGVGKIGVWRGAYGYHNATLNGTKVDKPSEQTLRRIRKMLEETYPTSEIAMICFFTIGGPAAFVTFVILCCRPRRRH